MSVFQEIYWVKWFFSGKSQRLSLYVLIVILSFSVAGRSQEPVNSPEYFSGGDSDLSSTDPDRAGKAVQKWTNPAGKQGEVSLKDAPFFWDATKVGRPVFIRIIKNSNREGQLEMWLENPTSGKFEKLKTYRVHYFSGTPGPKTKEGDLQAPEGFYHVSRRRLNPQSNYHLSMDIGYPNAYDRLKNRSGSLIMIHGSTVSVGCFAMTDGSIEQIYTLVSRALGQGQSIVRVHVFPFEMTPENLEAQRESPHYEFWQNLQEGWNWFEEHRRPPNVTVENGRYRFSE